MIQLKVFFCQVRKTRTMGDGCCTGFARCILVVFNIIFVVRKHVFFILHHYYLICFYSMIIHYQIMRQKWAYCGRSVKLSHLLSFFSSPESMVSLIFVRLSFWMLILSRNFNVNQTYYKISIWWMTLMLIWSRVIRTHCDMELC